jgi:amidase
MGSRHLRDANYIAPTSSWLFDHLEAAGFVVIGKTNTPEFGLLPTTEPLAYGPSRNPWKLDHSTGGSSGGSAAAVAAGIVPVGHAGDGGGSIRIPASECGLVGLKPSRGRVSLGPIETESWGGLVARLAVTHSVRDTASVLDAVSKPGVGDPYALPAPTTPYLAEVGRDPGTLRIGFTSATADGTVVDPECIAAVEAAAALLAQLGHQVSTDAPPQLSDPAFNAEMTNHVLTAYMVWVAQGVDNIVRLSGTEIGPDSIEPATAALAEAGRLTSGVAFADACEGLRTLSRPVNKWWANGFDLLVTPTIAELPPALGQFYNEAEPLAGVFRSTPIVTFTVPFNITGQPAISLPLGRSTSGLPIGVQLVAAYGREDVLLRVAAQLEAASPWTNPRPAVWAG